MAVRCAASGQVGAKVWNPALGQPLGHVGPQRVVDEEPVHEHDRPPVGRPGLAVVDGAGGQVDALHRRSSRHCRPARPTPVGTSERRPAPAHQRVRRHHRPGPLEQQEAPLVPVPGVEGEDGRADQVEDRERRGVGAHPAELDEHERHEDQQRPGDLDEDLDGHDISRSRRLRRPGTTCLVRGRRVVRRDPFIVSRRAPRTNSAQHRASGADEPHEVVDDVVGRRRPRARRWPGP